MTWYYYLCAALFGLAFGSFFNVCIYRMPRDRKLGNRSECPACTATIRWYDNIPLVSFIVLKGRCRECGARISWRYPLVELTTALLFVLVYWWSVNTVPVEMAIPGGRALVPELFIGLLLVSVLVICVGADVTHGIVPSKAVLPGTAIMLALVVGLSIYRGEPGRILLSLTSGLIGGGFLFLAGIAYGLIFLRRGGGLPQTRTIGGEKREDEDGSAGAVDSREEEAPPAEQESEGEVGDDATEEVSAWDEDEVRTGIGLGDVRLMFFAGIALGYFHWYLIVVALLVGYFVGAVAAIFLMVFYGLKRKEPFPFVPFLAAGSIVALVWGQWLVDVYLKLLR
jgi:leader peptidase (prepilin peptidase)/N-methyltransferase